MLGRLALLDSTLTFFFTLTLLAFAKWLSDRSDDRWFLCFAASASLTVQAKVTGVLVLMIALPLPAVLARALEAARRDLVLAALVFLAFLTPAVIQALVELAPVLPVPARQQRAGHARALALLPRQARPLQRLPAARVWGLGIVVALRIATDGRPAAAGWVLVLGVFFQTYPLKAFNYLLPAIPALSILGARGLYRVGPVARGRPPGRAR